jgi:methionyl-tRNA synthetase
LECKKVPKSDKLLQFKIDDGVGERTILSGIAAFYPEPEKLNGTQVCFIANFPPKKLRGMESEGMILSAENSDGTLTLVQPSRKIPNGSRIV